MLNLLQMGAQMNKRPLLIIPACVLIMACSMAPKYKRPAMPVPAELPGINAAAPEDGGAQVKWREFIKDEKLVKVVELALENNRDLRIASLNVERVQALYRVQRSTLLPHIDAIGSSYKEKVPPAVSGDPTSSITELYTAGAGVASWEFELFGRVRSLNKMVLQRYLATREGFSAARMALISQTALTCYALAADRETLSLSESTLETRGKALELMQKRYDVGLVSEIALNQAKASFESARIQAAFFRTAEAQDRNALDLIAGTAVPAELLPENLSSLTLPGEVFPGSSSETLLNRPDIIQAEHMLESANANIGAARAAFFPFIGITTSFGSATSELSRLFDSGTGTWLFASNINLPIFDFGEKWNRLKASKVDKKIAVAQYEKAIQTAFREVADALAQKETVDEQIDAHNKLVEASSETRRLADLRYQSGIDGYLSLLDAERSLYAARQQQISARLLKISNQVALYKALGGGSD
jgi:outer membrane protein, multidrug efflux system